MNYLKVIYQNLIREHTILMRKPAGLIFSLFFPTMILVVIATSFPGEFLDIEHVQIPIMEDGSNERLVTELKDKISSEELSVVVEHGGLTDLENMVRNKKYLLGLYPRLAENTPENVIVIDNSNPLARDAVLAKIKSRLGTGEDYNIVKIDIYEGNLRFIDYLFPGVVALGIMFFCLSLASIGVVRERVSGTLERIRSSFLPLSILLISKYITYIILAAISGVFILISGYVLFNIPIAGPVWLVILLEIITAAPFIGLALITSTIAKTEFESQVIVLFISIPSIFVSGVFFPIECMPEYTARIVKYLPLSFSVEALRDVIIRGGSISQVLPAISGLMLYSLAFFIAAVAMFKKRED
jgi:ABC-2 type transport system permease protein